jgi:hypothetical protein
MSDIMQARKALIARILEGDGRASPAQRCAAFDNRGSPRHNADCMQVSEVSRLYFTQKQVSNAGSTLRERHHTSRIA